MNNENRMNESYRLNRRDALKGVGVAATSLALASGAFGIPKTFGQTSIGENMIELENAKPGTRGWLLTNTRTDPTKGRSPVASGRSHAIEGYCSANSVRAGEKLQIMVSTNPASAFKLEIFRTGYYNGDGARLVKRFDSLNGVPQPDPPIGENYLRECQ